MIIRGAFEKKGKIKVKKKEKKSKEKRLHAGSSVQVGYIRQKDVVHQQV